MLKLYHTSAAAAEAVKAEEIAFRRAFEAALTKLPNYEEIKELIG